MMRKLAMAGLVALFVFAAVLLLIIADARGRGDEGPAQPIAFSHAIHAGKLGLECTYCHQHAAESSRPGIPPVSLCMSCHETAAVDRPEVRKLREYWDRREPIEWARVHRLPWHARFTHRRHVQAGVACTQCHGEVKVESRVRQVRSLKMGWCVTCHRSRDVSTDCWVCHK
jgi:hypothetical protein